MSQITNLTDARAPGLQPSQVCENLDDCDAARLLPTAAFKLITALDPERINSSKRAETLGKVLSVELAVDDPLRRAISLRRRPGNQDQRTGGSNRVDPRSATTKR